MQSPFKFLDSYTKEDRHLFFGRDAEIDELYHKIFESKILLVYGISGTGKTSLINCGLANKFNDSDWLPINIRRANNINDNWRKQTEKKVATNIKDKDLKKSVKSLYLDYFKPIYFIFDQFEELFIQGSKAEILKFVENLKSVLSLNLPISIIIVIREEYLAHISEMESQVPEIFKNHVRINHISKEKARETIIKPLIKAEFKIEQAATDEIINQMLTAYKVVDLAYLQIYMQGFFDFLEGSISKNEIITKGLLAKFGKVEEKINDFFTNELINKDEGIIKPALVLFDSPDGTKQIVKKEKLNDFFNQKKDIVDAVIKGLGKNIVFSENYIELKHDALSRAIYNDAHKTINDLHFLKRQIEYCLKENEPVSKDFLKKLRPYQKNYINFFTPKERNIIKESEKQVRIIRTVFKFFVPMAVVFLFFLFIPPFMNTCKEIREERAIAKIILQENKGFSKHKYREYQKKYIAGNSKDILITGNQNVKSFKLDLGEVTIEEYEIFCSEKKIRIPVQPYGYSTDDPVVNISYDEANEFAKWCGKRLPTLIEINYALHEFGTVFNINEFKKEFEWTSDTTIIGNYVFNFLKPVSYKVPKALYYLRPFIKKHPKGKVGFRCAKDIK